MIKRALMLFAGIGLVLPALVLMPSIAAADDTQCNGALAPGTYDNIIVPEGASCEVRGSYVKGSIKALPQAVFLYVSDSTVEGNIEGQKVGRVLICNHPGCAIGPIGPVVVLGNIDISEGGGAEINGTPGAPGGVILPNGNIHIHKQQSNFGVNSVVLEKGNIITNDNVLVITFSINQNLVAKGNITANNNFVAAPHGGSVFENFVGQNVQFSKNTSAGLKLVALNVVGENLQCFENNQPFVGTPNAAGKAEGQCAP